MFAVALYARAWVEIKALGDRRGELFVALYARAWVEIRLALQPWPNG